MSGGYRRVSSTVLLWILLLTCPLLAFDQVDVTAYFKSTPLEIAQSTTLEVRIPGDYLTQIQGAGKLFYVMLDALQSEGDFILSGVNPQAAQEPDAIPPSIKGRTVFRRPEIVVVNKDSAIWSQVIASGVVYLTLTNVGQTGQPLKVLVSCIVNDLVFMPVGAHYSLNVAHLKSINLRTVITHAEGYHHYKFLLEAREHNKDLSMTASGFKVTDDQQAGPLFNFLKYDTQKLGYVLDSTDPNYCQVGTCPYTLNVQLEGVRTLEVYIGEHINYEVVGGGEVTIGYIKENSPKDNIFRYQTHGQNATAFTLIPVEGQASLYVNPGVLPTDDNKFYYQDTSNIAKRVIISKSDLINMNMSDPVIFVRVHCQHACRYIAKAEVPKSDVLTIQPGFSELGTVRGNETRQHLIQNRDYTGDVIQKRYTIKLQLFAGEANLFLKNCPPHQECLLTAEETKPTSNSPIVVSHVGVKPIKQLIYPVTCTNNTDLNPVSFHTDEALNLTTPAPHSSEVISSTCTFMVGVVGTTPGNTRYELTIEEDKDIHVINVNRFTTVKLLQNQMKNYTLFHNHPRGDKAVLEFVFDGKYGIFDVCIQHQATSNSPLSDCIRKETIDASFAGASKSYRKIKFDPEGSKAKITGVYNVIIKSTENAGLIFGAVETDGDNANYLAKELKAGVSVSETIDNFQKPAFFTFKLDGGEDVRAIQVHLTPIRGSFVFAVRNDEKKPDLDQTFWKSDSNELLITNDDQMFKQNVFYTIGVYGVPRTDPTGKHDYHFHLRWSYTGKHNVLVPGIPIHSTLAHAQECFTFEINSNWHHILVAKHAATNNLDLFASVGNGHDVPSLQKFDFRAEADESGFEIQSAQLESLCKDEFSRNRHCNAYLCLHGKPKERYMIAFTFNNGPFLLLDGASFFGPLPIGGQVLHFIYHPSKESPAEVEEFSSSWNVNLAATLMESPTSIPFPAFTDTNSHSLTNLISFHRDDIAKLKRPVIAISLGRSLNTLPTPGKDFSFKGHFGLEAGYMSKELVRGTPRVGFAEQGEWKYFHFYNSEPSLTLYVGMDSLNQGDGDLYISRGKDRRPTLTSHLARSFGIRSAFVTVPIQAVQGRGYEDLTGFYTVAVHANSNLRYSLFWRHTRSNLMVVSVGIPFSTVVKPSHPLRVMLYNNFDEDIEIQINAHHHNVMLYWTTDSTITTYRQNDMELFPNNNNHKIKYMISRENGARTYTIPKSTVGFCANCKWYFTVESLDSQEPVDLDFKLMVSGAGRGQFSEEINPGVFYELEADKDDLRRYRLPLTAEQYKNYKSFYVETHILVGSAEVFISEKPLLSVTYETYKAVVNAGYNNVTFEHVKIDQPENHHDAFFISIKCISYCRMKFAVVEPGKMLRLPVNTPREAISTWKAGNETFVYEATGREKQFEVTFQVEYFIDHKEIELVKNELYRMIRVYYAEDLATLTNGKRTTLKTKYRHADEINNKVILDYKPRKGVFLVEIASIPQTGYAYTLQVQTTGVSILYPGRYTVGRIGKNSTDHVYEMTAHKSGPIFMRLGKCFANVNAAAKSRAEDYGYQQISVDGNRYTKVWEAQKPGETIFLKLQKEPSSRTNEEFGYLDHTKNISIFSLDVFEKQNWDSIPFDKIRPLNEDLYIDLKGSSPTVRFRPVQFPHENMAFQIIYHVVVSKDPDMLNFYLNCGGAYIKHILKKGYKKKDAIGVFSLGVDPQPEKEFGTNLPYLQGHMKLESGMRYFVNVIAFVKLKKPEGTDRFMTSNSLRVMYRTTEFEYRSFFYPIELMASTLGLVAILLASFFLLNANISKYLRKLFGRKTTGNEIDSDLEEYYMQIKNDFDYEERVRSASKPQSPGESGNSSMALDTSTVSERRRATTEEKPKRTPVPPAKVDEPQSKEESSPSSGEKGVELSELPKTDEKPIEEKSDVKKPADTTEDLL